MWVDMHDPWMKDSALRSVFLRITWEVGVDLRVLLEALVRMGGKRRGKGVETGGR